MWPLKLTRGSSNRSAGSLGGHDEKWVEKGAREEVVEEQRCIV